MIKLSFFLLFSTFLLSPDIIAQCTHLDDEGLMELYNALDGPNWEIEVWHEIAAESNCDPCTWGSITCRSNRVLRHSSLSSGLYIIELSSKDNHSRSIKSFVKI